MNILFLTWNNPAAHSMGGEQRNHLIHRALCDLGTVYTAIPALDRPSSLFPEPLTARVHAERRFSLRWLLRNAARLLLREMMLSHSAPPEWPPEWKAPRFDLVVARHATLAAYWRAWEFAPLIIDSDDFPSELYADRCPNGRNRLPYRLLRRWQTSIFRRCAFAWIAHEDQAALLPSSLPHQILENIPFDPGSAIYDESAAQLPYLLTVGTLSHPPNYHGLSRFVREVWPAIHTAFPDLHWKIAGRDCPPAVAAECAAAPNVELLGFVPDLASLYRNALACLVPVATGSGTCIKVREALLWGRTCLGWPFAFRGIPAADQTSANGIFPCKTPDEFVSALQSLASSAKRLPAQRSARAYALAHWSPTHFSSIIRAAIATLPPPSRHV